MGDGVGEVVSVFFLVVSFLVVPAASVDDFLVVVDSFLVASVVDFLVDVFFIDLVVVDAGAVVVVDDSVLVVQEAISPAASKTVME